MNKLYEDLDDKTRDSAQKISIAFDENAWNKMEALLDEDDRRIAGSNSSENTLLRKGNNNKHRLAALFLLLFFTGAPALLIKNSSSLKNKSFSPVNSDTKIAAATYTKNVGEIFIDSEAHTKLLANKNFKPQATLNKKITLSTSNKRDNDDFFTTYKRVNQIKNFRITEQIDNKKNIIADNIQNDLLNKDDLKKVKDQLIVVNEKDKNLLMEMKDDVQEMNTHRQKKDLINPETKDKNKTTIVKNKFFKNIGLSVFASPEINTVKFKSGSKVTLNYGAGVDYSISKHFSVQAQFVSAKKIYVTDRKGYNPAAGSPLVSIDTLKVNANCNVWDIPVNVKYSFTDNSKNNFFISAGISSYIMKKEVYDFSYYDQGVYETKKRIIKDENKHGFCNLNLSVGYQYWLSKKLSIGFEPYCKLPLSGIGAGKVKLTSAGALLSLTFKPM